MQKLALVASVSALFCTTAVAQVTTANIPLGGSGAVGCQLAGNQPLLTNGVAATARLQFTYDASNGQLTVVVTNDSPVVAGESNPVITTWGFNLPEPGIDGITLLSQSAAMGNGPNYTLSGDVKVGCLGTFDVFMDNGNGAQGGIANGAAPVVGGPAGFVLGPATFQFQLTGIAVPSLNAGAIANSFSELPNTSSQTAFASFQGGGINGAESGFIGAANPDCVPAIWLNGEPKIGTSVDVCTSAGEGCHGCIIVSLNPTPFMYGPYWVPLGGPVYATFGTPDYGPDNMFCFPVAIPNQQSIVGLKAYATLLALEDGSPVLDFSQRLEVTLID